MSHALPLAALGLLFLSPEQAQAHSVWPGSSDFGNGLLHPLFTPTHLLLLAALGLWLGQRTPFTVQTPFFAFAPACGLALGLSILGNPRLNLALVQSVFLCATGLLIALDAPLARAWQIPLFAGAALALGLDSGLDEPAQAGGWLTLCGTWISLTVLLLNVAYYSSLLPPVSWAKMGVRVLGSWLCAIALLMIAFALRKH